jgi:ubiquinone/menaquinone biosynthesis C-methylase UbiE
MCDTNLTRKEKFRQYFENVAPKYDKYRQRFSYYWNSIIKQTNYFICDTDSVIEIGCGTGLSLSKTKGQRKVGLDFSQNMIEIARKNHPDIEFHICEAEKIEIDEKFDVILLSNVIGYFDDVLVVLHEIQKLCKPSTRIIITYYNHFWEPLLRLAEMLGLKKRIPNQNWLSIQDIRNLLYLAGFETYHIIKRELFPVYFPGISWLFNKVLARLPYFNNFCLNQFVFARPIFNQPTVFETKYSTSVVVPARNESGNIEEIVNRLPDFGKHVELIFVEGNSTDDTWGKICEIQQKYSHLRDIKIVKQSGKGKGDAVRKAYSIATGDILMILDADMTVPPEILPKFYYAIASGKGEFINGSRLVYPMEKNAMRTLNTLGNKFFSKMFTWILGQPIKDTLCGTKVMFRSDYLKLAANRAYFGDFDPFGDFDLIFGAYKLNLKIIDLPVRYMERKYGDTNISRFRHGLLLLKMTIFAAGKIKFY